MQYRQKKIEHSMQKKYKAKSMTAFARTQENTPLGRFSWEIRSVNQRYLEINPRLPDAFRHLEPEIRNQLKKQISRGKIDISLSFENNPNDNTMQVNQSVLQPLTQAINELQQSLIEATQVNPLDILKWPGILQTNPHDENAEKLQEALNLELLNALQTAITLHYLMKIVCVKVKP